MALPPGPRAPKTLQTVRFLRDPGGFLADCHRRYGDIFRVSLLGGERAIYVAEPGLIREAFATDRDGALTGAGRARVMEPMVGSNSLLTLDGPAWERQRRLLGPAFHGENIARYAEEIREIAAAEIGSWSPGELELRPRMQAITLEVILRVVFGVREGERLERLRELLPRLVEAAGQMMWAPPALHRLGARLARGGRLAAALNPARRFFAVREEVDGLLHEEIAERRADPDLEERGDVLSWLVAARDEEGEGLTDAELRDELVGLLEAGHETTATALAWTFERLTRSPAALEGLLEALPTDAADEQLEAVARETLRVRPVVFDVVRVMVKTIELGGYEVPEDWYLAPAIVLVQMREPEWPQPQEFRPERFLGERPSNHSWIPFGGGRRRCVGAQLALMEMRIATAEVLRRWSVAPTTEPPEAARLQHVTLAPAEGGRVMITERAGADARTAAAAAAAPG